MSPRPGPRRPQVAIRISEAGIEAIDDLATQAGVTRSEMARRLLSAAVKDPAIRKAVTKG